MGTGEEWQTGLTQEQAESAIGQIRTHGARPDTQLTENLKDFSDKLIKGSESLVEHERRIVQASQGYERLTKEQQKAYQAAVGRADKLTKIEDSLETMGTQGAQLRNQNAALFDSARRISSADQEQLDARFQRQVDQLRPLTFGRDGNWGERAFAGAKDLYHDFTSGWKMMQVNRLWGMTGGKAIQAQQAAMSQEMAVQGAIGSWSGAAAGQLGPVSQGILGIQAQQANAQAAMGRGSFMAYGGVQQALSGVTGEAAGIALPAVGAGMIAGTLGATLPAALGIGAAAGVFGLGSYASRLGKDPAELAYKQSGGFFEQIAGGLGLLANDIREGGLGRGGDARALRERGRQIRSGDISLVEGDTGAQAVALRHWAGEQSNIMSVEQWAGVAGQYQAARGGVTNLNQIPAEMLEKMAIRGYTIPGMVNLAQQLGGTTGQFEQLTQSMLAQPNSLSTTAALSQYAGAGQMGLVGMDWFNQNMGGMQEMTGWQSGRFNRMMGGDRYLWSQYASGANLGLTGTAMDILGQVGPQPWMQTMEAGTGLPLFTNNAQGYSGTYGALESQAAQQGGLRGIQWAQLKQQTDVQQEQEGRRWDRFQMGYAYKSGDTLGGYPGSVPSGLMGQIQQTGGVWGLEDQQRAMSWDWQQTQFGFQQERFDVGNRQWMENWQARWSQQQTQQEWAKQDFGDREKQYARQDEHWLFNWGWQENMAQLQFGWQQEDLDEGIRFATGRRKLQLMRQKERATTTESMRSEKSQEAKDYWEDQKEWRDQEHEKAKERHDERAEWAEENLERARRHHEEDVELKQREMDATRRHAREVHDLQETRIRLDREYWKEMQKAQADDMMRQKQINEMQNRLRADQMRLTMDAQNAVARFNVGIQEIGRGIDAMTAKVRAFNDAVQGSYSAGQGQGSVGGDPPPDYHDGGPVGMSGPMGAGEVPATLETGEFVVPRAGALVARDDRVVDVLERIAGLIAEGNGRFTIMVQNPEQGVSNVRNVLDAAYR
jgi:hypothetical protein